MKKIAIVFAMYVFSIGANARPMKVFKIADLPHGKELTLGKRAVSIMPVDSSVVFKSMDDMQSIKITPTNLKKNIRLAIKEGDSKVVRYVNLEKGLPFLYNFHGLSKLSVVAFEPGAKKSKATLKVESNKPLSISR